VAYDMVNRRRVSSWSRSGRILDAGEIFTPLGAPRSTRNGSISIGLIVFHLPGELFHDRQSFLCFRRSLVGSLMVLQGFFELFGEIGVAIQHGCPFLD